MMEDSVKSKLGWLLRIAPAQSNDAKVDTTLALAVFVCICKKIYMYANWKNLLSWSLKVVTKLFLTCLNRNKMQYHVSRIGP